MVDFESHKIYRIVVATIVSELYACAKCFGARHCFCAWSVDGHQRRAYGYTYLVTTSSATRLPEQQETLHMIQMLRKEACSGQIEDFSHVVSADCLSDCRTKA